MRCDVTTFEVELEQEKTEKIAAVAARGAVLAREFGQDPDDVQDFLRHYFRHVDAIDVDERTGRGPAGAGGQPLPGRRCTARPRGP